MSDGTDIAAGSRDDYSAGLSGGSGAGPPRHKRRGRHKRRVRRIALYVLCSILGLAVALAVGIYAYVNHIVGSIPRIPVPYLVPAPGSGQTFLVTSSQKGPAGAPVSDSSVGSSSGLLMLLHINTDGKGGGVVAIPEGTMVNVPGAGTRSLSYALNKGGPSLLVHTLSQVTGIAINHYAQIDFSHITKLVNAIGGVDVTIPEAGKSFGYTFKTGANHLTGITAIYYAREPSLSDRDRMLRQANLVHAILVKIADDHLVTSPVTAVRVLNSITGALTVDSDMTNSEVESLARSFGHLGGSAGTFVVAPTHTVSGKMILTAPVAGQLWTALKHDSMTAFAKQHPATVTPASVP
jgi:LCP family protein required for cell wall assembly